MKILLVSANTETINMPVLPLGLGYVAAATQIAGYDIKLLNLLDQKDSLSLLKRTVHDFRPDVIGISVRNIDDQNMERPRFLLGPVKNIISECRKISNATIVLGGSGYSIFPQAALDYLDADMGIQGEGEVASFDHFFFVDNTFNLPSSYAKSLCVHMVGADLNITWRCILYPWKVDEALVKWMARAGCKEVALGCESGCEQILRTMNKQFNLQEVRRISQILKDYGIRQMGFLLLGGPGETKESVKESLFFADSLNLETVKVTVGIRIYPHTALAGTAVRQGLISADDDLLYPRFYLDKKLEKWLPKTAKSWLADRPNWIS